MICQSNKIICNAPVKNYMFCQWGIIIWFAPKKNYMIWHRCLFIWYASFQNYMQCPKIFLYDLPTLNRSKNLYTMCPKIILYDLSTPPNYTHWPDSSSMYCFLKFFCSMTSASSDNGHLKDRIPVSSFWLDSFYRLVLLRWRNRSKL